MSEKPFATAGCLCGAVRYTIHNPPVLMVQCHCTDCQKLSGTGHASQAFFRSEYVEMRGEPTAWAFESDRGTTKNYHFCSVCGSRLHGTNTGRPGLTILPIGCVDEHDWYEPAAVAYTSRREAWDVTSDEIANFDTMPPVKS